MKKVDMPFTSKVIQFPFVYQYVTNQPYIKPALIFAVQRFAKSTRSKQAGLDEDTTATIEKITKIATYQFVNHAGFLRAFLGTIVDFPFTELRERYRNVGRQGDRSVLLIWGDKDTVRHLFGAHAAPIFIFSPPLVDCTILSSSRSSRIDAQY